MRTSILLIAGFLIVCLLGQSARCQDPPLRRKFDPRDIPWRDEAASLKLSADELRLLEQNKFVIGQREYRQIFQPYLGGSTPVFITSDSVLNAYHVLLEESLKHLEHAQLIRLRKLLPDMWKGLAGPDKDSAGDSALMKAARRRAQIVLGTGIRLLDAAPLQPAPAGDLQALIDAEVKKVIEATAMEKPAWLGQSDAGFAAIAYSRFKPRGFYAGDAPLERYFRCVAWLGAIPFRVANDEEVVSAMLLGHSLFGGLGNDLDDFLKPYREFLGSVDDLPLDRNNDRYFAADGSLKIAIPQGLAEARQDFRDRAKFTLPKINDQVRGAAEGNAADLTTRILPARQLPDAAMFQDSTDPDRFPRKFPSGLDVAAMLGSPLARANLEKDAGYHDQLIAAIAEYGPLGKVSRDSAIYEDYLHTLSALFDAPEKDVPALFASAAWQAKNCQTALASWAQMRHTWILQAKENNVVFGAMRQPSGFVEPNPEFFSRFAELIMRSQSILKENGAFEPDIGMAAADLRKLAQLIEKNKADADGVVEIPPSMEDQLFVNSVRNIVEALRDPNANITTTELMRSDIPKLRALADQLDRGDMPADPKLREVLLKEYETRLEHLWQSFSLIARRLESLANKQLRGVAFNEEEDRFIKSYGESLAAYMLYFGNSYEFPRDDAPRVADVFMNPKEGKVLEVGIGRARAIYLLYPWQGREILCRGAVMSYYEFTHPAPMTDVQWKTMLDAPGHPEMPGWAKPIYAPGK
jgi:hypothetical protein